MHRSNISKKDNPEELNLAISFQSKLKGIEIYFTVFVSVVNVTLV